MTTATVSVKTGRRDWFRIIRDLMKVGISMGEVARKCGRHPKTVAEWANGSEPRESDARVVLALYAKYCPIQYLSHHREFAIPVPAADESDRLEGHDPVAPEG